MSISNVINNPNASVARYYGINVYCHACFPVYLLYPYLALLIGGGQCLLRACCVAVIPWVTGSIPDAGEFFLSAE